MLAASDPPTPVEEGAERGHTARYLAVIVVLVGAYLAVGGGWSALTTPATAGGRPTPTAAASDVPLGEPAPVPAGGGPFAFSLHQPDGTAPVAYDPCRPIRVVVNDALAPPGSGRLVEEALAEIRAATGLSVLIEGTTVEVAGDGDRPAFQPQRYGDRWAPVLVTWADPALVPALAGDVAGIGGSTAFDTDDAGWVYVTGSVVLDAPQVQAIGQGPGGYRQARAVVVHELAHVIGLDHVEDPGQLMHPSASGVTELQAGDRAGLAALGRGACAARL